jgi:catechol 2,3-dioxygenase-like lactoylglutathione lyase family enzyme
MRFGHLELFVSDTVNAARFYSEFLGFEVTVRQPGGFVWLKSGDAELLLRPGVPLGRSRKYDHSGSTLVIYVEALREVLARLADAGHVPLAEDSPGCPVLQDPDGHWIQLVEYTPG